MLYDRIPARYSTVTKAEREYNTKDKIWKQNTVAIGSEQIKVIIYQSRLN